MLARAAAVHFRQSRDADSAAERPGSSDLFAQFAGPNSAVEQHASRKTHSILVWRLRWPLRSWRADCGYGRYKGRTAFDCRPLRNPAYRRAASDRALQLD